MKTPGHAPHLSPSQPDDRKKNKTNKNTHSNVVTHRNERIHQRIRRYRYLQDGGQDGGQYGGQDGPPHPAIVFFWMFALADFVLIRWRSPFYLSLFFCDSDARRFFFNVESVFLFRSIVASVGFQKKNSGPSLLFRGDGQKEQGIPPNDAFFFLYDRRRLII